MELDITHIFRVLWKRKVLIMAVLIVTVLASVYYNYAILVSQYEASAKLIVNDTRVVKGETSLGSRDLNANIQLIQTYKELVCTEWIARDVLELRPDFKLTLDELLSKTKVTSTNNSQMMTISVIDPSYERAVDLVNTVASVFGKKVSQLYKVDNVKLLTSSDPKLHPDPVKPNRFLNILLVAVAALIIGITGAFVMQHFDDRIRKEKKVNSFMG